MSEMLGGKHAVAEPDFYIWVGQGVARATSGGPQTKTENVYVTLAWHLIPFAFLYISFNLWRNNLGIYAHQKGSPSTTLTMGGYF